MADHRDQSVPDEHHVPRVGPALQSSSQADGQTGQWLPQDKRHQHDWIDKTVRHVDANPKELHPVLVEFQELYENDSRLYMLFNNMFEQVCIEQVEAELTTQIPHSKPYLKDPSGELQTVRDFPHLLQLLNHVLTTAPAWTDAGHSVGLVGVPINALLDWPMATRAGFTVFQDPQVNAMLKKVLNAWGEFLNSPESADVLDEDKESWFGESGKKSLLTVANLGGQTEHSFDELFQCEPSKPHHGFKSWDDFFTRLFRDGIRPVASPEDDNVVANCCESKTYKVAHDVKARDKFWVKGQPYSVVDMLAHDPWADQFVGGTVYQAFLSALSYHRWHTPVSGTIKKAYVVDGTYFSEPLFEDFTEDSAADANGECTSQEYISVVATRAIIFIEADNPKIGLMCFMGIGMTEVSTCETTVKEGQHVNKGDQLG